MTYLIANFDQLTDAHCAGLPPDCKQMSVRELLMWLRDRNERENRPVSNMLSHIARPTVINQSAHYSAEELLQQGTNLLDQFFFVGIVEKMPESLNQLKQKLQNIELPLVLDEVPTLNTSSQVRWRSQLVDPRKTLSENTCSTGLNQIDNYIDTHSTAFKLDAAPFR